VKFLKVIVLVLSTSVCLAEEIQQGKLYPGGAFVESSQTGVGLTIPQGWQGAWPQGSEMFVLESTTLKANIFMTFEQGDEAGLKTFLSNPVPLDARTRLVPASPPKKEGKVYTANYTVAGAPQLSAYIAAQILPPSMGVAFIALSADKSTTRQVEQVTLKLANSLTVKPPTIQSAGTNSAAKSGGELWKVYFKGRYIARYYTGSDYYETQHLWLCSDGRFLRKFESGGSSLSGASGASSSRGEGFWTATGSTSDEGQLILQFGAGSLSEISTPGADYSSSSAGGERWVYRVVLDKKLYLDGKKWLPAGKNKVCD